MIKVGYFKGERLHIKDYLESLHANNVYCADGHLLIAKKGEIRTHHFSHKLGQTDCQCGGDMSDWHLWWQNRLKSQYIECKFTKDGITKIADSLSIGGPNMSILNVIEYQNSKMGENEMKLRESFYSRSDLMSEHGMKKCNAQLTWIFNLTLCDIEIDFIFGDIVCFHWVKGSKFMLNSKARTFYDFGKRDLIQVLEIYKPKIHETKFIGRFVPIENIDKEIFCESLRNDLVPEDKRLNTLRLAEYVSLPIGIYDVDVYSELITTIKKIFFTTKKIKSIKAEDKTKIANIIESILKINKH